MFLKSCENLDTNESMLMMTGRTGVRSGVLTQKRARSHQRGQEAHQHHPHHRGRAPPAQVPHACRSVRSN